MKSKKLIIGTASILSTIILAAICSTPSEKTQSINNTNEIKMSNAIVNVVENSIKNETNNAINTTEAEKVNETTTPVTATKPANSQPTQKTNQQQSVQSTTTPSKSNSQKATTTKPQTTTQQATFSSGSNYSGTVYITPTGKRYHFLTSCGGKNSKATTLSDAKSRGLTPCNKCAK